MIHIVREIVPGPWRERENERREPGKLLLFGASLKCWMFVDDSVIRCRVKETGDRYEEKSDKGNGVGGLRVEFVEVEVGLLFLPSYGERSGSFERGCGKESLFSRIYRGICSLWGFVGSSRI